MKTYILSEDHKITVEDTGRNYKVTFYEYYASCDQWHKLSAETWSSMEDVAWYYDL